MGLGSATDSGDGGWDESGSGWCAVFDWIGIRTKVFGTETAACQRKKKAGLEPKIVNFLAAPGGEGTRTTRDILDSNQDQETHASSRVWCH